MPDITFIHPDGRQDDFEAPEGVSLMQAATGYGIDAIVAECGGQLACATCHVYVDPAWLAHLPPPRADELDMLGAVAAERRPESRLSCQIRLTADLQGLVVRLPDTQY